MTFRSLLVFAAVAAGSPAFGQGGGLAPESNAPRLGGKAGIDEKIGAQVPLDVAFRDEDEKPITLRECIGNKPTILVMAYYRCPVNCTDVLNGLVSSLRGMPADYSVGNQFNVVTVSFDFKEHGELASRKKETYIREYGRPGADKGWRFLTGSKEAIKELTDAIGFRFEYDKVFKEYNHPTGITVLSPDGKVMRYFYGIAYDRNYQLLGGGSTTLRMTLIEAADGKGGSLIDQAGLFFCFSFDPHNKKYSLSVRKLMRLAGVATMLAVAVGVGLALRRDRRRNDPVPTLANPNPAPAADTPASGPAEGTK
ncbi:MAG TPA: SCO family protein [Gemmataceae bacterium]|nr:SCO family protein [Gemmataceae bacterium]